MHTFMLWQCACLLVNTLCAPMGPLVEVCEAIQEPGADVGEYKEQLSWGHDTVPKNFVAHKSCPCCPQVISSLAEQAADDQTLPLGTLPPAGLITASEEGRIKCAPVSHNQHNGSTAPPQASAGACEGTYQAACSCCRAGALPMSRARTQTPLAGGPGARGSRPVAASSVQGAPPSQRRWVPPERSRLNTHVDTRPFGCPLSLGGHWTWSVATQWKCRCSRNLVGHPGAGLELTNSDAMHGDRHWRIP